MKKSITFLIALLFFSVSAIAATDDPWVLLEKASQAARALSYKGIFVYQTGGNSKSVQITHMNYGHGEYSRMVVLDGSPREALSHGNDMVIFNPRNEKVVIEKKRGQNMFPALLPDNMELIKTVYLAQLGSIERVGGRDGYLINLTPKDQYRYGYKMWVDKEYGLLLKSMMVGEKNAALDQVAFSQILLMDSQNMDWFRPTLDKTKAYVMEKDVPSKLNVSEIDWEVSDLPIGYRKVDQVRRMLSNKQTPAVQLIFSDGLSSVSVFIEDIPKGARPKVGHTMMGATHFYALVNDAHQVIAVGEVPEATVSHFANAVTFKNKPK
jgi:sigma-E factor negative regulatory protein RseB